MAPLLPRALQQHPPEFASLLSSAINHIAERDVLPEILPATRTLKPRTLASLIRRQQVTITATSSSNPKPLIPANYDGLNTGPTPGTVVGIVFGSVAGFLLILWLIYTCLAMGGQAPVSSVVEEDVVIRRHSRSRSPRRPPSSHSHSEVIEVSRTRQRSKSRSRSRSPPRRQSSRRETTIIEETRRVSRPPPQDEFVEVTEERSPPPSQTRRSSRRQSGFRTIDPDEYAGGDRPMRKVSRR